MLFKKKIQITTYKTNGPFEQKCLVIEVFKIIKMVGLFSFTKNKIGSFLVPKYVKNQSHWLLTKYNTHPTLIHITIC